MAAEITNLDIFRLIIDFGLVVLIWLVQLVIYPSFRFYQNTDLKKWHLLYTKRVTIVVMPLMLTQLYVYIRLIFQSINTFLIVNLVLIALVWVLTFVKAIPLHKSIDTESDSAAACDGLIKINFYRAILWSLVFIISLYSHFTIHNL